VGLELVEQNRERGVAIQKEQAAAFRVRKNMFPVSLNILPLPDTVVAE
jgi:hypothetical protein